MSEPRATLKEIRLSRSNSGWNAAFLVDGKPDAEVVGLFNTHLIPTAFTKHALESEVVRCLRALNPSHSVAVIGQHLAHKKEAV